MAEDKCSHEWYCRQRAGDFGEQVQDKPLGTDEILDGAIVCSGGIIFCPKCDATIPPGQELDPLPNLREITNKLKE